MYKKYNEDVLGSLPHTTTDKSLKQFVNSFLVGIATYAGAESHTTASLPIGENHGSGSSGTGSMSNRSGSGVIAGGSGSSRSGSGSNGPGRGSGGSGSGFNGIGGTESSSLNGSEWNGPSGRRASSISGSGSAGHSGSWSTVMPDKNHNEQLAGAPKQGSGQVASSILSGVQSLGSLVGQIPLSKTTDGPRTSTVAISNAHIDEKDSSESGHRDRFPPPLFKNHSQPNDNHRSRNKRNPPDSGPPLNLGKHWNPKTVVHAN